MKSKLEEKIAALQKEAAVLVEERNQINKRYSEIETRLCQIQGSLTSLIELIRENSEEDSDK